ncbi:DUF1476 domain-containing protein [Rhodobacteraceae bacterium NNCM2]|nr:DUF1476 domain-containing protein [Coraliihabitans acroporae]
MTQFDERERAFEAKFVHDTELQFKADARRNRLVGLWAAGLLGHPDPEAYAKEVVAADFEEAGHEDVYRKLAGDLGDKATEAEIRKMMADKLIEAKAQIMEEM